MRYTARQAEYAANVQLGAMRLTAALLHPPMSPDDPGTAFLETMKRYRAFACAALDQLQARSAGKPMTRGDDHELTLRIFKLLAEELEQGAPLPCEAPKPTD